MKELQNVQRKTKILNLGISGKQKKKVPYDDDTEEEKMDREVEIWKTHYSSKHRILLVGEGDFSFSRCLARAFGSARNMVATSLDTQGTCIYIYLLDPLLLLFFIF